MTTQPLLITGKVAAAQKQFRCSEPSADEFVSMCAHFMQTVDGKVAISSSVFSTLFDHLTSIPASVTVRFALRELLRVLGELSWMATPSSVSQALDGLQVAATHRKGSRAFAAVTLEVLEFKTNVGRGVLCMCYIDEEDALTFIESDVYPEDTEDLPKVGDVQNSVQLILKSGLLSAVEQVVGGCFQQCLNSLVTKSGFRFLRFGAGSLPPNGDPECLFFISH